MSRRQELVYALNAGGVDPDALSRVDLEKMRLSGEHPVVNWFPKVLGPMTLRPGTQHLSAITGDAETLQVPFVKRIDTKYMLLLSVSEMRVSVDGANVQVPAVSTAINSGSWTDESTGSAAATGGATLSFTGANAASAKLRQAVTVASGDRLAQNILRIVVSRGPLVFRVGTAAGGEELIKDTVLDTGTHKISIVPGAGVATIYIDLWSDALPTRGVSQIQFESTLLGGSGTGDLVLPTPWTFEQVQALRFWQSLDVLFCGDGEQQQRKIEHRGTYSWSVVLFRPEAGPFQASGVTNVNVTPAALTGNTTLTASQPYWRTGHVGALVEVTQSGKTVEDTLNLSGAVSDYVTIVGAGNDRSFTATGVDTAFVGVLFLERSLEPENPSTFTIYNTFTDGAASNGPTVVTDGLDNLTAHYRFRISSYTSGSVDVTLEYTGGITNAVGFITQRTSSTVVDIEVMRPFGTLDGSVTWRIGTWSDDNIWPRTPAISDGRMYWFGRDVAYGSVVDDYPNYDDTTEGDSGPIIRSVGSGGEEGVLWAVSASRLVVGSSRAENTIQASDLDEAITPTAFTVRKPSKRGSADIPAAEHNDGIFFVQRSGKKIYELSIPESGTRYRSQDVSRLNPSACNAGVVKLAVQQQPDTRLYAVLSDGSMVVLTYEPDDKVIAFTVMTTPGGTIEDVAVLPNADQDDVYLIVLRGEHRYHEKLAPERNQISKSTCALLDSHTVFSGPISTLTGLSRFDGETIQVWADGERIADKAVSGGSASLGATYSRVVAGKSFDATFKSAKLAYAAQLGTAVGQEKLVRNVGLVFSNSCLDGVRVGKDEDNTDPMPDIVDGAARTANQFFSHFDHPLIPIPGDWNTDSRLYIEADSSEGPVTVQAVVTDVETRERVPAKSQQ